MVQANSQICARSAVSTTAQKASPISKDKVTLPFWSRLNKFVGSKCECRSNRRSSGMINLLLFLNLSAIDHRCTCFLGYPRKKRGIICIYQGGPRPNLHSRCGSMHAAEDAPRNHLLGQVQVSMHLAKKAAMVPLALLRVPRYLRRCTLCGTHALGDERHFVFECPSFQAIRSGFTDLFDAEIGRAHV